MFQFYCNFCFKVWCDGCWCNGGPSLDVAGSLTSKKCSRSFLDITLPVTRLKDSRLALLKLRLCFLNSDGERLK